MTTSYEQPDYNAAIPAPPSVTQGKYVGLKGSSAFIGSTTYDLNVDKLTSVEIIDPATGKPVTLWMSKESMAMYNIDKMAALMQSIDDASQD